MRDALSGVGRVPGLIPADQLPVLLGRSWLAVRVREDSGLAFMEIRSRIDPSQSLLLPVGHRPALAAVTSFTRLSALHALCWGLAFGVGVLADDAVVRFESGTLRHRTVADATMHRLPGDWWVADAEGVFAEATLLAGDREQVRVALMEP